MPFMVDRVQIMLSLSPEGTLDSLWLLALLTAVGAFIVTYLAYRGWLAVKRAAGRAADRVRGGDAREAPKIGAPSSSPEPTPAAAEERGAAAERTGRDLRKPGESWGSDWGDESVSPKPSPSPASPAPSPSGNGSGRVEMNGAQIHAPRERASGGVPGGGSGSGGGGGGGGGQLAATAPPTERNDAPEWERKKKDMALNEWESLVQEVMGQESVLARSRGRLSKRRSLQSLLASIRDRDLLYERGERIGGAIYAESYTELGDRLQRNSVCEEAVFRKGAGDTMEIRLIGTSMAREAPVIGTCVCFMEAGLLAGAMKNIEGAPHEVREAKCAVKGDPFCEFRATRAEPEEKSWADDPSGLTDGGEEP